MAEVTIHPQVADLAAGLVWATGVAIEAADESLRRRCEQAAAAALSDGPAGGDARRQAVRDLLRRGGYKPSGRSKPAQEYLLRTVRDSGGLPAISNAVDLINLVSLRSGLPISLLSLDRVGSRLLLRYGRQGETYVFNRAGQELDLQGLLCLCIADGSDGRPVGSPVKDSMYGKVEPADHNLLACMFGSRGEITRRELEDWCRELADGFVQFCGASAATVELQPDYSS